MTVEKIKSENENYDNFPVGMRVLAVDDDPVCLKLLDTLLRKCQYHVTATSHARTALKMLRENKDGFDLVISDVHMPDMDGFKLLELVGLEMDLPVIMLSVNSDPKLVLKGVTHGACDYLIKPVRVEELRNIWQHVIRRKKFVSKNPNKSSGDHVKANEKASGEAQGSPDADENEKTNRKRKDEEDESEYGNESDEPGTQKKPRVVWSIELHRKFVAAVNHLGIEKAFPKRILDMMNVEGLTRENVASHLQKYRLYLKRISSVATQQANMAAAFGIKDSHFMRIGPFEGLGDFRTLAGPGALSQYSSDGMILGRLNTPIANVNHRDLNPSAFIQPIQNMSSALGEINQNPNLFQGIPLEFDQFQQNKQASNNNFTDQRAIGGPSVMSSNYYQQQALSNGVLSSKSFNGSSNPNTINSQLDVQTTPQTPSQSWGIYGYNLTHAYGNNDQIPHTNGVMLPVGRNSYSDSAGEGGFNSRAYDSSDDMMNPMIKREHETTVPNYDFEFDGYAFGM